MKQEISIIGAGSWGTTLAIVFSRAGIKVNLHSVFKEHNLQMQKEHQNRLFLKGVEFPSALRIEPCLKRTLNKDVIVSAVPVKFLIQTLRNVKKEKVSFKNKVFVSVSKGIESKSLKRPSQLIEEILGTDKVAVLSGPNIAKEVLKMIPSAAILACKKKSIGKKLQMLFTSPTFRVYSSTDVVGVELGGALKNIIALSCGI